MPDLNATKATFSDKAAVVVKGRVMATSATGDYCMVQFLTKSGETTVAIPVEHIRHAE